MCSTAKHNANIHRGIHVLAEEATAAYEGARERIAGFINAPNARQVVYTRNATESVNLVAYSWGRHNLKAGDVIIATEMEHHSNLVPWQMLASELDLRLEFIPVTEDGLIGPGGLQGAAEPEAQIGCFSAYVECVGDDQPGQRDHPAGACCRRSDPGGWRPSPCRILRWMCRTWMPIFTYFSGHKMLGPTGIGGLYGKEELLQAMPPFMGGGDMIKRVELRRFVPNDLPYKFEAGTACHR